MPEKRAPLPLPLTDPAASVPASVLYAERVQAGLTQLGVDVRIGSRVPVYSTAVGQAILAWLPRETQLRVLGSQPLVKLTATTITDPDLLPARPR